MLFTRRTLDLNVKRVILHGDLDRDVGGSQEQLCYQRIVKGLTDTCAIGVALMFTSTARHLDYDTTYYYHSTNYSLDESR